MAKLKNPLLSIAAAGTLGGIEYRGGTYGAIVGRRSISPALQTPAQLQHRSRMILAHAAFDALSDADRAAWELYATLPSTGRNAFTAAFLRLAAAGYTPANAPRYPSPSGAIKNAVIAQVIGPPPAIWISYDFLGDASLLIFAYTFFTWANRADPNPRAYAFYAAFPSWTGNLFITPKILAPTSHIRLDLVDTLNGSIIGSTRLKLLATW